MVAKRRIKAGDMNADHMQRISERTRPQQERLHEAKLERVRSAIDEGDAAGDAEEYSLDGLLADLACETD
jgi:hypothetical protein